MQFKGGWSIASNCDHESIGPGKVIAYSSYPIIKSDLSLIGEVFVGYGKAVRKLAFLSFASLLPASHCCWSWSGKGGLHRVMCRICSFYSDISFLLSVSSFIYFSRSLSFLFLSFYGYLSSIRQLQWWWIIYSIKSHFTWTRLLLWVSYRSHNFHLFFV